LSIGWKIGFEIELMAPRGATRATLAEALAERAGGRVRRFWHQESEPSVVKGSPIFHNMTLGFEALDAGQEPVARCVDDLTLQADFDKFAKPLPGWHRIVSDDERLLRLVARHTDPELPILEALAEAVSLFGTELLPAEGGMLRLVDESRAPIAIAAPLPGERERPCELISPPISSDHEARLDGLLSVARELGFGVPVESATHLHFDASALCSAKAISNLVRIFSEHALELRALFAINPNLRRVGGWPKELIELVAKPAFRGASWQDARAQLEALTLSKYCDFNLKNIAHAIETRHTFEVRILPGSLQTTPIIEAAEFFEALLTYAISANEPPKRAHGRRKGKPGLRSLIEELPLRAEKRAMWLQRAAALNE